jgi:CubicO group peptidase (beta-lactamase class C family)
LRIEALRELFRRAGAAGLSGGFLIGQAGEVIAAEAFGVADPVTGAAMRTDAVFDTGSVSKQFTAAAVLALEDDGQLSTRDRIARFFPAVPPDKQAITIHHLLTHTAGFAHDVGDPESLPARDEAVREILASELLFPPGEKQAYSNTGYALLAAIVELASGRDFEAYLRERLWQPLGMSRTGMVLPDWEDCQVAAGLTFHGPEPGRRGDRWDPGGPSWFLRGCGYISSTMQELYLWSEALRTGAVLSDAARAQLFFPHAREPTDFVSYYGYGWQLTAAPDGSCLATHNGSAGIHYDVLGILPAHEAVFVTFCTQQSSPWKDFPERALGVLAGTDAIELPPLAEADTPVEGFAGSYRLPSGGTLELVVQAGRLTVPATSAEVLRLFCPWPPADASTVEPLGDRVALATALFDGIARGDYEPLAARLPLDVPREDERAFWDEYWPRWEDRMGAYQGADLIDTVHVGDSLRSLVLVRFARASTVIGLVHSGDDRVFLDTMPRHFLPAIVLAPQGGREFVSFHLQTRRMTRVVFEGPIQDPTVTIGDGSTGVIARRSGR